MNTGILLIRADASTDMGTGHVMRCLALAFSWQAYGGRVVFLTVCRNPAITKRITTAGCELILVEKSYPHPADLQTVKQQILKVNPQWLVVDGYHFNGVFQKQLQEILNGSETNVLIIDDYGHNTHYVGDMILNQNLIFSSQEFEARYGVVSAGVKLLPGPYYALLRPEFARAARRKRTINSKGEKILVTLGGADPDNQTEKIIKGLNDINLELQVAVIVGAANPWKEFLLNIARKSRHEIELLQNINKIQEHMLWADVALSAGGSTCWEMCCLGLPNIILTIAENQRVIADSLARYGASISLGWSEELTPAQIGRAVRELLETPEKRSAMSSKGRKLVDGKGAERVVEAMCNYS